jgi:alpha-tectorin
MFDAKYLIFLYFSNFQTNLGFVPLDQFFPYGTNNGDAEQDRGDDNSSPMQNLTQKFAYFGTNYSTLWVNTNGAFSFRTEIKTFTPSCNPLNATYSMVAPFW